VHAPVPPSSASVLPERGQNLSAPPRRKALRRLWQRLPQSTRTQILANVSRLIAPLPDRAPRGGMPIAIAGLYSTASGIGEGARLAYAALEEAGMAPAAFDLSAAFGQAELHDVPARRAITPGSGGTLVVFHNGPFLPHALWALGRERIRGRRIIGDWAWEFPRLPQSWRPSLGYLHEIWVPSSFCRESIAAATDLPVHVVPRPLPSLPVTPNMRERLGLPADALIVLTAFHFGSAFVRKNPIAAIAAFRRAFGDAPDRVLVIKVVDHGATRARRQLEQAIAGASNIRVVDVILSPPDMSGLLDAADIVTSLHRTEGFGLVPAEAMRLGKPVVATAWSGTMDFMNANNSALVSYDLVPVEDPYDGAFVADGQLWAEANVDHAADWLSRLAADPGLRQRIGNAARADISRQLSPETVARTIANLIEAGKAA
jgi:glycosyltransferase involved in cell wall biosynthesis